MKYGETLLICIVILFSTFINVIVSKEIKNEIKQSKEKQERFDGLVRDSVKMHKIYENWELNYGELKKLEE